jgi:hypothetical protein
VSDKREFGQQRQENACYNFLHYGSHLNLSSAQHYGASSRTDRP